MLSNIYVFRQNLDREGHTYLIGVNEITFTSGIP
jgi:hypothetical protein